MIAFYQEWLKTTDAAAAFKSAQEKLKNTYPAPYYWGAFVLIGN
jgi:CHAT domain-containing protein